MRKLVLVATLGLVMIAASLLPVAKNAAAEVGVEVGDYWKYEASANVEGMLLGGTIKLKVTDTEGTGASEVYVITLSGSGDLSGSFESITVSGSVDYSGTIKRLVSNFSMVSSNIEMDMTMKMMGESAKVTMGIEQTYSPAIDDYIGDDNPGHGATLVCRSTVTSTVTMDMEVMGQHVTDSETTTDDVEQTIEIADSNETVSVPAGDFDCYKYTYSLDMMGYTEVMTYYYSDEVGYIVKSVGTEAIMGTFGNEELKSYSYGGKGTGGGAFSLTSGTGLLVLIVIIVAIVVVVSLVLMMRKRGKAPTPMMPPPQMGVPPPPPPPPGA